VIAPSLTSAADNPHAATYRGLVRALAERGHDVTFLEADPPGMAPRRDLVDAGGVRIALYAQPGDLYQQFTRVVRDADLVLVGSGVRDGVAIGSWVIETAHGLTAFYDLDTPGTLAALEAGTCGYLSRALVPRYAMYLSGTGGPTLARIEQALGSPRALPLYEAVDPVAFGPAPQPTRWALGFVGEHHPDRQPALQRLLIEPARRDAACRFAIAGTGYPASLEWAPNIEWVVEPGHPRTFYNAVAFHLSVTRPAMQATGWSPRLPLFEAAACAVPSISDAWDGLDELFEPNQEILIAHDGDDVLRFLRDVRDTERRAIGARACTRIHASHTAAHRAAELERYVRT
jgi:spore maturation protein CgeB